MLESPPMELQQVDLVDAQPVEPLLHALPHDLRVIGPGAGHHLVKASGRRPFCDPRASSLPAISSALP